MRQEGSARSSSQRGGRGRSCAGRMQCGRPAYGRRLRVAGGRSCDRAVPLPSGGARDVDFVDLWLKLLHNGSVVPHGRMPRMNRTAYDASPAEGRGTRLVGAVGQEAYRGRQAAWAVMRQAPPACPRRDMAAAGRDLQGVARRACLARHDRTAACRMLAPLGHVYEPAPGGGWVGG